MSRFSSGKRSRRLSGDRGVALLIVITILVTMVIVAVPFVLSMGQGAERTKAVTARSQAQFEAGLLTEIAKLYLVRTHPDQEQQRFLRGDKSIDAQPGVDSLDEITPNDTFRKKLEEEILSEWINDPRLAAKAAYLKSRGLGPLNDDRGSIWTVLIQDAQALVNVNGASPYLLGNLLGSALLADDLDTGGGDIAVEHVVTGRFGGTVGFPPGGGFIRIGREVISYETFDGSTFRGCERGALLETPLRDNGPAAAHQQGEPVIDYTAYKLATHLIARKPGYLTPFRNLEALRDIASWGENGVISADRLERVLPYLTVWSRRETSSGWLAEQLVVNQLGEQMDGSAAEEVRLRDLQNNPAGTTCYFNAGTLARFSDGESTVYQMITGVGDAEGKGRDLYVTAAGRVNAFDESLKFPGGETRVAGFAPYPININTASRPVLYAVMANIQLWRAKGKDQVVTPELAWQLAGDIVRARKGPIRADAETGKRQGGPFRTAEDFARFLEGKLRNSEIKRPQFQALYLNAINPHNYLLRFGTAPWCFRTMDVYHLESRVALNNRAGEQIAEAGLREVVEIGSDSTASWVLDSQDEFEQRLAMGSGAKWATTYPFAVAYKSNNYHHIQPAMRGPKGFINNVYPNAERGNDLGDVRLEPARMLLENVEITERFDQNWYADGHYMGFDGAYTRKTAGTFTAKGDPFVRPFSMSFWWRPYSSSDWTAFDAGMSQFQNRYAIFVQQGEEGQELTFRCCASTMARQGAEVYVPLDALDYERGNWYHIHVSCDGEDPASMQMLVDGVDIGKRRGVTYLAGSLTADSTDVPVESTDGFPVRGALRIGNEIIEYDTLSTNAFRDCVRGARGTEQKDDNGAVVGGYEWAAGTPVQILGYTMPLLLDTMRGGAYLEEALRKWSCVRVSTLNTTPAPDTATVILGDGVTPIVFGGFGPDNKNLTVEVVGMWGQADDEGYDAFNTKGIAILGCPPPDLGAGGGAGGPPGPGSGSLDGESLEDDGFDPPPDPPSDDGGNHDQPGDGVPPGSRDGDDGGGTAPDPGDIPPGDTGGGDTGGGDTGGVAGGDSIKLAGWEIVYYERQGNQFTIERYQATAWQGEADPYFLITENRTAQEEYPAFLIPISVLGQGSLSKGEDYLDPGDPTHRGKLEAYGGDGKGRILIGTDTPTDAHEVIQYDSIDYDRAAPGLLFVRDRSLGNITGLFFEDPIDIQGGTAPGDDPAPDDPPPVPDTDDPPPVPPVPPGDGFDPPSDNPDTPRDPTPGDGVPPGQRDPTDPPGDGGDPGQPGDPVPDPGDGGGGGEPAEPGLGDDPAPGDTGGGGFDDPGEDGGGGEPGLEDGGTDPRDEEGGGGGFDEGGEETPPSDEGGGGGAGAGGGVDPGQRGGGEEGGSGDTSGTTPPPEEPTPDDSGGGGDFGGEESGDEEGDAGIPNVPPPGSRDPSDPETDTEDDGNTEPTGTVREPPGPGTAMDALPFRGVNGTVQGGYDHTSGSAGSENSLILPCFRVYEGFTTGAYRSGRNDVITITDGREGGATRIEAGVRWGDADDQGEGYVQQGWMALTEFVDHVFEAPLEGADIRRNDPRGRPRILKFPCGELPDEMSTDMEFGQSAISGSGLVTAFLDELNIWRHPNDTKLYVAESQGIQEEGDEIRLASSRTLQELSTLDGYDEDCGLFLLEGELIVYRGLRQEGDQVIVLERCARGQMGTRATFHGWQSAGRFIPDVPVSYLESGVTPQASTIPLARTRGWPREGLMRIVRDDSAEMVHYTRRAERELIMPVSLDADERTRDRGLFRGRFGTEAADHDNDAIVIWQPFRYWDRFAQRRGDAEDDKNTFSGVHDHPEASYLELGKRSRSAVWRGFTWDENLLGRSTGGDETKADREAFLDIFVMARFNPNVDWDTNNIVDLRDADAFNGKSDLGAKSRDHVFLFDDIGDKAMGQGKTGNLLGLESDTAEFRVFFVFKPGAFVSVDDARKGQNVQDDPVMSNAWKLTPWLRSFSVNYFTRTMSRYRAPLR